MKLRSLSLILALLGGTAVYGQSSPDPIPMETSQLGFMVGSWACEGYGMGPDGSRQAMKGEAQCSFKMGNRWLSMMTKDELEGYGTIWGEFSASYDPEQKKWVGTWKDSMSPLILVLKGEMKGNVLALSADPVELTGMGKVGFEVLYTKRSDDEFSLTVSMVVDGQKMPAMTNVYKRVKSS